MIKITDLSKHEQYLQSPKTWVHANKQDCKILCFFLQLFLLPFLSMPYILLTSVIYLLIWRSIKIPNKIKKEQQHLLIFIFIIALINFFVSTQIRLDNVYASFTCTVKFQFPSYFDKLLPSRLIQSQVSIPLVFLRLSLISIIYLIVIRIFILTTRYETIIYFFIQNFNIANFFF